MLQGFSCGKQLKSVGEKLLFQIFLALDLGPIWVARTPETSLEYAPIPIVIKMTSISYRKLLGCFIISDKKTSTWR